MFKIPKRRRYLTQEKNMRSEENRIIFNKKDHNGESFISKTTFVMSFSEKDIKVVFSLN
jgi:hypothetical protein